MNTLFDDIMKSMKLQNMTFSLNFSHANYEFLSEYHYDLNCHMRYNLSAEAEDNNKYKFCHFEIMHRVFTIFIHS